jgi:hypothetical protein
MRHHLFTKVNFFWWSQNILLSCPSREFYILPSSASVFTGLGLRSCMDPQSLLLSVKWFQVFWYQGQNCRMCSGAWRPVSHEQSEMNDRFKWCWWALKLQCLVWSLKIVVRSCHWKYGNDNWLLYWNGTWLWFWLRYMRWGFVVVIVYCQIWQICWHLHGLLSYSVKGFIG